MRQSDKGAGVVALTLMDIRARRGVIGDLLLCGVRGTKFPSLRTHMQKNIADAYPGSAIDVSVRTFPDDTATNPKAYLDALKELKPGSAVTVFTPDDSHYEIAMACVKAGMHVLVTKPLVMTLEQHHQLHAAAQDAGVLVMVEVHKRFDPMYTGTSILSLLVQVGVCLTCARRVPAAAPIQTPGTAC